MDGCCVLADALGFGGKTDDRPTQLQNMDGETVATVLELHEAPVPLIVPTVLGLHSDKHI